MVQVDHGCTKPSDCITVLFFSWPTDAKTALSCDVFFFWGSCFPCGKTCDHLYRVVELVCILVGFRGQQTRKMLPHPLGFHADESPEDVGSEGRRGRWGTLTLAGRTKESNRNSKRRPGALGC